MVLNISEVTGSTSTTGAGSDGWTFDIDLSDPSVVVVSGDFDVVDPLTGVNFGETLSGYLFGALSTNAFGSLVYDDTTGTFTFNIDRQAVLDSGSDQSLSFTVTGRTGIQVDEDTVYINLLICVARGTMILTDAGEVPVESLCAGDRVWTRDDAFQPVRWVDSRKLSPRELKADPTVRPVRIRAGALGPGKPARDFLVSPQHKVLIDDWRAEFMFGEEEVLVPAKGLVNDHSILVDHSCEPVEYFHVLFDRHQIIRTDGAETESFRPGAFTLREIERSARAKLMHIFPELARDCEAYGPTARYSVSVREAVALRNHHAA